MQCHACAHLEYEQTHTYLCSRPVKCETNIPLRIMLKERLFAFNRSCYELRSLRLTFVGQQNENLLMGVLKEDWHYGA